LSLGEISGRDLCGQAQIDPNHMRSPAGRDFGKATHAATDVEDEFSSEIFGSKSRSAAKRTF
jgi:hypothetical protein